MTQPDGFALCYPAGALGMRTVHQVDAKAQLLVRMLPKQTGGLAAAEQRAAADDNNEGSGDEAGWLDAAASGQLSGARQEASAQAGGRPSARAADLQGMTGDSDVLPAPRFVGASGGAPCRPLLLGFSSQEVAPQAL